MEFDVIAGADANTSENLTILSFERVHAFTWAIISVADNNLTLRLHHRLLSSTGENPK